MLQGVASFQALTDADDRLREVFVGEAHRAHVGARRGTGDTRPVDRVTDAFVVG